MPFLCRLAIASVAVGAFDGAAFASGVIMEGEVAKRGLSGWKTRYAVRTAAAATCWLCLHAGVPSESILAQQPAFTAHLGQTTSHLHHAPV